MPQRLLQPPQLLVSLVSVAHAVPQHVEPLVQAAPLVALVPPHAQPPDPHVSPVPHALPHDRQFAVLARLTQLVPQQSGVPAVQA